MKYAIKSGRTFLKTKATNFLGTVLNIENHHTKNMDQGSDAYASYVDGLTDTFCTGSFFHLPEVSPFLLLPLSYMPVLTRIVDNGGPLQIQKSPVSKRPHACLLRHGQRMPPRETPCFPCKWDYDPSNRDLWGICMYPD